MLPLCSMARVLVVEDDPSIRDLVVTVLEEEGFDVSAAANGEDALNQLQDVQPDAIVLDLMMPIMDGWTFVEECRHQPWCGHVPIIVTSAAHDLPRTIERLKPLGVRACLPKPYDLDELLVYIDRFTNRSLAA